MVVLACDDIHCPWFACFLIFNIPYDIMFDLNLCVIKDDALVYNMNKSSLMSRVYSSSGILMHIATGYERKLGKI